MNYFATPYRRAQLYCTVADSALGVVGAIAVLRWFPYPANRWLLLAWPVALTLLLFAVGGYDLSVRRSRQLPLRLMTAVLPAALLVYPFLSGPDRHRAPGLFLLAALTWSVVWLTRRVPFAAIGGDTAFVMTSDAGRTRFESARGVFASHYRKTQLHALTDESEAQRRVFEELRKEDPELVVAEIGSGVSDDVMSQLFELQLAGVRVADFVEFYASVTGRVPLELVDHRWLLRHGVSYRSPRPAARLQRLFGVAVSAFLLAGALPLLLLTAIGVWLTSGRPVLVRQERLGHHKRPFTLYKFRTMYADIDVAGAAPTQPNDPRITRSGRWLRKFRLDELPQLFNLVRGDMRLIGPRPIRAGRARDLAKVVPFYDLRFLHPPGLTGWAQVLGPYGETADGQAVKLEMELHYFTNAGAVEDAYILAKTVQLVLRGTGT